MPSDMEGKAREFYAGLLGMIEIEKPPALATRGGAWFRSGDVFVHLGVDKGFQPARKAHPAFVCADYDELVERLRSHGVYIHTDDLLADGRRHCYIADPFGNRVELISQ